MPQKAYQNKYIETYVHMFNFMSMLFRTISTSGSFFISCSVLIQYTRNICLLESVSEKKKI